MITIIVIMVVYYIIVNPRSIMDYLGYRNNIAFDFSERHFKNELHNALSVQFQNFHTVNCIVTLPYTTTYLIVDHRMYYPSTVMHFIPMVINFSPVAILP